MHFSFSPRFLVPDVALFWFVLVLAVGRLGLMVPNILGEYFQQLWLGRNANQCKVFASTLCSRNYILVIFSPHWLVTKIWLKGEAAIWRTNGKSSRIHFLKECGQGPSLLSECSAISSHGGSVARMQKADCPGSRPSSTTWRDSPWLH